MTDQKMNPEIKTKWVEALRSGEYKQGVGWLKTADGKMCCLGVLVELQHPDMWVPNPNDSDVESFRFDTSANSLPMWFRKEVGLDDRFEVRVDRIETVGMVDVQDALIELNDETNMGFLGIADWIEETL